MCELYKVRLRSDDRDNVSRGCMVDDDGEQGSDFRGLRYLRVTELCNGTILRTMLLSRCLGLMDAEMDWRALVSIIEDVFERVLRCRSLSIGI